MLIFEFLSFILFSSDKFLLVCEDGSLLFDAPIGVFVNPLFKVGDLTVTPPDPLIVGDLTKPVFIVGDTCLVPGAFLPPVVLIVVDIADELVNGERKLFDFVDDLHKAMAPFLLVELGLVDTSLVVF